MLRNTFRSLGRVISKTGAWLAYSLMLLSVSACQSTIFASTPTFEKTPVVGVDELQFKDTETGQRFRALDRCVENIADDSWRTTSYQLLGNFYTSSWCNGAGAGNDCQIAHATVDNRDQQVIQLNTLFYPQNYPEVFGIGFNALWVPQSTGWGAYFYFAENGASVVGDSWGVSFREYTTPANPPAATVQLGWNYGYTIYGPNRTEFDQSSDLPLREDLALYLSSPEAMRDRGIAQNQTLAQKVSDAIQAHQVYGCDLGPYLGDGIPPACTPRPLTAEEETVELDRARAYFAEQEQLLRDYYQEMYTAWLKAFPLNQCWP